jgi:hypothetical protein
MRKSAQKTQKFVRNTAAEKRHEGVMWELLEAGCNTDRADNDGNTPVLMAVKRGHEGVVRQLLASFCDTCAVVTCWQHDHLKVLFDQHFAHLFLAFLMAGHTRVGSEVCHLAGEKSFLKVFVANVDLMQMVFEQAPCRPYSRRCDSEEWSEEDSEEEDSEVEDSENSEEENSEEEGSVEGE